MWHAQWHPALQYLPEGSILGLTGMTGAGKTTLCQWLSQQGYAAYHCDVRAKELMHGPLEKQLILAVGEGLWRDTNRFRSEFFRNPALYHTVTNIVWPAVFEDAQQWIQRTKPSRKVIESAVLYASGLDSLCTHTLWIDRPSPVPTSPERDPWTQQEAHHWRLDPKRLSAEH